jgi:hypothetical protein
VIETIVLKLSEVRTNPFRDLKANPFHEPTIEKLMVSIEKTGLWPGLIVRKGNTGYELAYGHHRVEAAKRLGIKEHEFIVEDLDNTTMLQKQHLENMETRGRVLGLMESVRAIVEGLTEDLSSPKYIPPFIIPPTVNKSLLRHAPSFCPGDARRSCVEHPYTAFNIDQTLSFGSKGARAEMGKASDATQAALGALCLIEMGHLSYKQIQDYSISELLITVRDTLKRITQLKAIDAHSRKLQNAVLAEQIAKETERKERLSALNKEREETKRAEEEARAHKDKEEAEKLAIHIRELEEQERQEEEKLKLDRPKFDARMKAIEREAQEKTRIENEKAKVNSEIKTIEFKLNNLATKDDATHEHIKSLLKTRRLDQNQRERVRRALANASSRLRELAESFWHQSEYNRVDVLAEARQKEELNRKVNHHSEYEQRDQLAESNLPI